MIAPAAPRIELRYASVCAGIEAASVAWHPLGWRAAWFSEIAPLPCAVLAHHYPTVPNLGDMTRLDDARLAEHGAVDLLIGGTPCQSFSFAGLRKGLADPRGNLALEFLRLLDRTRARWVVWENVPGVLSSAGGRDFGAFLGGLGQLGYGFAYRVLDAQYFGVAQRRRRVFVVGHAGGWARAAAVLFESSSLRGDPAPSREAGARTSAGPTLGASHGQPRVDGGVPLTCPTLRSGCNATGGHRPPGTDVDTCESLVVHHAPACHQAKGGDPTTDNYVTAFQCHGTNVGPMGHLRSWHGDIQSGVPFVDYSPTDYAAGEYRELAHSTPITSSRDASRATPIAANPSGVRRLTPRECERLQGFPDDWTLVPYRGKPAKDGPRYMALGNSMAAPVVRWIGERIARVEEIP